MTDPLGLQTIYRLRLRRKPDHRQGPDGPDHHHAIRRARSADGRDRSDEQQPTTTTYDGDSEVIQVDDALGRITTTTYDNRGWVATVDRSAREHGHLLVHGDGQSVDVIRPHEQRRRLRGLVLLR